MTYIILNSLELAELLNKKINDYMISTIPRYNATQWSKITTDNNGKYAVYIKYIDKRNPITSLNGTERTRIVSSLPDAFFHTDADGNRILNYVRN